LAGLPGAANTGLALALADLVLASSLAITRPRRHGDLSAGVPRGQISCAVQCDHAQDSQPVMGLRSMIKIYFSRFCGR